MTRVSVGLKAKAVIALAVLFLAIQSIYVLVEDRLFVAEATASLQQRARLLADLYAGAVSGSVWEYDKEATRAQLKALQTQLPEFERARIVEPEGHEFIALGVDSRPAAVTASAEIRNDDNLIGTITIELSDGILRAERAAHLTRLITTAAIMGTALLVLTLIALHLVIRPLERITPLMRSFAAGDLEHNVPYRDRNDEVGAMARALEVFREHASRRLAAELALKRHSEELDRLNRDLSRARDAAEAANRVKSDFLAAMSHEIRTPLNGILGMLHLLAESKLDPDQRTKLGTLERSAQSLLSLLNDILDLAKIEAGRVDLHIAPFSPRELLGNMATLWQPMALSRNLALTVSVAPSVPPLLLGDGNRLGQVVANYLSNAMKFTDRGGVTVSAEAKPVGDELHEITIAVKDTGVGIAPEAQKRLFQKFSQAELAARKPGSTGLGLAISKELIQLMNGTVGVESAPGAGATFWLRVQCRVAEPAEVPTEEIDTEALLGDLGTRKVKVLVAEDNPVNQRVVCAMLELGGHGFVLAHDGQEALEAVQREAFDLVLMDVQMPVMDGPTATRAIRALGGKYRDIPIVALTANAMPGDEKSYRAAGMNHYLSKPFSPDELSVALRRAAGPDVARIRSATFRPAEPEPSQQQAMGELLKEI
ncbi:MAG TPA: ATP-binding protein [Candidatus Cybelea sp.]|nr:ATP-binding protein [Candidatus Cybelea sp.]